VGRGAGWDRSSVASNGSSAGHQWRPEVLDKRAWASSVSLEPLVRRVLRAQVPDPAAVDDLTQETLMRLARSWHRVPEEKMPAYASVVARNLACSQERLEQRQRRKVHLLADHSRAECPGVELQSHGRQL
jgi:DNA-directed RNA polymerase specialized sigma24 family protein